MQRNMLGVLGGWRKLSDVCGTLGTTKMASSGTWEKGESQGPADGRAEKMSKREHEAQGICPQTPR